MQATHSLRVSHRNRTELHRAPEHCQAMAHTAKPSRCCAAFALLLLCFLRMVPFATFVPASTTPALRSPRAHPAQVARHARGGEGEGDVVEQLLKPGVVLLDVRTEEEYMDGHVPGSVNIPHTEIKYRKNQLPPDTDTPMVVFCARGIRAQMAQDVLRSLGYTDVVNGMTWQAVQ
ncbi:pspE, partial [Symbiodinium necroappetens]